MSAHGKRQWELHHNVRDAKKKKKVCHAYFHHLVGREKQRNDNIKFRIVGLPLKGRKRNAIRDGQIGY